MFESGLQPKRLKVSNNQVESPSKVDIENSIQAQIVFLRREQDRLNQTREMIESGLVSETRKDYLETEIEAVKIATERLSELKSFKLQLGYVIASSGFRVASASCAVDWGIVEVDEERVAGNLVSLAHGL